MTKKNKTPLEIFTESIGLYFSNFSQFVKYMTFPVLGQIAGLTLVFFCTYIYSENLPNLIEKYSIFNNFNMLVLISIIVAIPGMIIFMKAFWEYLVAYGAINSMLDNMLKSGKVYDFDAHTELIKRRTLSFIGVWFLFGIFSTVALIPLFWVPAGVLAVFFVLVFQVFTYEPELSPIGCVKKSLQLVKGHFASTFMLMALVGALTYVFIPQGINTIIEWTGGLKLLSEWMLPLIKELPIDEFNNLISYLYLKPIKAEEIALFTVTTFIAQILIQYTLPVRSLLWGLWYRELNGHITKTEKKKRVSRKTPSENLMEESHKKYGNKNKKEQKFDNKPKKLDRNILRRAMEKSDEEEN